MHLVNRAIRRFGLPFAIVFAALHFVLSAFGAGTLPTPHFVSLILDSYPQISACNGFLQGNGAALATCVTGQVASDSALRALPPGGFVSVRVTGFRAAGDMPAVDYLAVPAACATDDGGSCKNSNTSGWSWKIAAQTIPDPRRWGAYGDAVTDFQVTVTTASGSGAVTVTGGTFTSADIGKYVVITDQKDDGATASGASYQGTITAVSSNSAITVSPNVGFSVAALLENVSYGHDDSAALNAMIAYIGTVVSSAVPSASNAMINFGGRTYGAINPIVAGANGTYANGDFLALASANFSCVTGLLKVTGPANATFENLTLSSDFLPVNGVYQTANGNTLYRAGFSVRFWQGSCGSQSVSATGSTGGSVVTVTSTAGLAQMMVSHGNAGAGLPDRAMIVAVEASTSDAYSPCPGSLCVVINKPLTANLSGTVTFYTDVNGFQTSNGAAGFHMEQGNIREWEYPYSSGGPIIVPSGDLYGCGMFLGGGGQSDTLRTTVGAAAASVCINSTGNQQFFIDDDIFNDQYNSSEVNPPSILIGDGASAIWIDHGQFLGPIQKFFSNKDASGSPVSFYIGATQISSGPNGNLTPAAGVQFYAAVNSTNPNISCKAIRLRPDLQVSSSLGGVNFNGRGTYGTDYAYSCLTADQAAAVNAGNGQFLLGDNSVGSNVAGTTVTAGEPVQTPGFNLLNGVLQSSIEYPLYKSGNYTINYLTDCPSNVIEASGSANTVTLQNAVGVPLGCHVNVTDRGAGTTTIHAASGATLYNGASGASGDISVTQFHSFDCRATFNNSTPAVEWTCK